MLADINGNLADLRSEAAMASQRFCLRWNNHQSNLLSVFDQLLHDEAFVDVTLAVDGRFLKAHKMVLSACSPYFQALFVGHPDKHPIVILKDVPYADMKSLLDFMYRGEVSVDQDRLTAFLRVAESLRIKGLTEVNEDKCDIPSITSSLLGGNQNSGAPPPPPNLHRINQLGHHQMPQKRYHHQVSTHPLLGSALTAPKRKRGRPRKLSGSSDTPMDSSHDQSGVDLVQGSPEMMEMKMGLDFQSETTGHNSSTGSPGSNDHDRQHSKRDMEVTENGTDQTDASLLLRIKGEPDPLPSTSAQGKDDEFTRPHSRQGSESFKQDSLVCLPSDTTFEIYSGCLETEFASDDDDDDEDDNDSTSASASEPSGDHHHHQSVIMNHTDSIGIAKKSVSSEDRVHFIADEPVGTITVEDNPEGLAEPEVRKQLLEYLVQKDGSVVCKWCGEVLPSRSRWYRHKYKLHVQTSASVQQQQHQQPTLAQVGCIQPAPLFKCQSCNAYFKSRKGYIGHLSSRHSGEDVPENDENREEACNAPNKTTASINKTQISHQKKITHIVDWEQQREKEEKLVADIIDRVKRECEAQGETVTRRGYSRRHTTVMNS